jgi:hypothetical protein
VKSAKFLNLTTSCCQISSNGSSCRHKSPCCHCFRSSLPLRVVAGSCSLLLLLQTALAPTPSRFILLQVCSYFLKCGFMGLWVLETDIVRNWYLWINWSMNLLPESSNLWDLIEMLLKMLKFLNFDKNCLNFLNLMFEIFWIWCRNPKCPKP